MRASSMISYPIYINKIPHKKKRTNVISYTYRGFHHCVCIWFSCLGEEQVLEVFEGSIEMRLKNTHTQWMNRLRNGKYKGKFPYKVQRIWHSVADFHFFLLSVRTCKVLWALAYDGISSLTFIRPITDYINNSICHAVISRVLNPPPPPNVTLYLI